MRFSKLNNKSIISSDKIELLETDKITLNELCRSIEGISRAQVVRNIGKMVRAGMAPKGLLRFAMIKHYHDLYTNVRVDDATVGDIVLASVAAKAAQTEKSEEQLRNVGYDLNKPEPTGADLWRSQAAVFERKLAKTAAHRKAVLKNPNGQGAFTLAHFTDVHLNDDATALNLLEADISASHRIGAITMHGGDALNAWPTAGKLAKKWAEQACTMPDALKILEHYINILRPDLWVDGNHEEMTAILDQFILRALPKTTARDYWTIRFDVETPGAQTLRGAMSHKFQKGSSWFHGLHGHLREMLEGEDLDLYVDGHYHRAATMHHHMHERGHSALLVASSGYKLVDTFAARISRGGKHPVTAGRAHWIVCDPQTVTGQLCTAFVCPDQAEACCEGLQNLRAA